MVMNRKQSIKVDVTRQSSSNSNAIREIDLNKQERKLLLSIENGDLNTVQRILDNATALKVNTNCVDPWGRTPLIVAIENDNMDLVSLLLKHHVALGDAILHAIHHDRADMVSMLIQYEEEDDARHKNIQKYFGESPSQAFSHEITPLMLACHMDNYPIIRMLIERGDRLDIPHSLTCSCKRCTCANLENSIRHSKERYNTYKALVSPSLICITSPDPILTAFELANELNNLSKSEYEYSAQYLELVKELRVFTCCLLDETRSFTELDTILNHAAGAPNQDRIIDEMSDIQLESSNARRHEQMTRLKLAIDFGEKEFVAHSHCQQLLSSIWFDGVDDLREKGQIGQFVTALSIGAAFPFLAICHLVAPDSKHGLLMQRPLVKFVCQTASYLFFILLIVLDAMRIENLIREEDTLNAQSHSKAPSVIQCCMMVYIFGFLIHDLSCVYHNGYRDFISRAYNLVSFGMISFFLCVIGLRAAAYFGITQATASGEFIDQDRRYWSAFDPIIVSEGLLACACILAVLKLTEIFTILYGLGPLMISIGNIINDIFLFLIVYFLVIFAFATGFQQLLWFYGYMWYQEMCLENNIGNISRLHGPEYGQHSTRCLTQGTEWSNLFNIFQSLYWGIFGLVFSTDLINGYGHSFEALMSKLVFGTYMFAAWPLLLNLLIALIIHTYSNVRIQEDIEWKFARARLFIRFFSIDESPPVPFNIIPSVKFIRGVLNKCKRLFFRVSLEDRDRLQFDLASVRHRANLVREEQEHYNSVMTCIMQRYLIKRFRQIRAALVNIDDITEVKQDLTVFRQDLLNILNYNGIDVADKYIKRLRTKVRKKKQAVISYYQAKLQDANNIKGPKD